MPKQREREPIKLVAIRPDGSKLFGQWQYQYQPGNSADEGWVWETWIEGAEHVYDPSSEGLAKTE